MGLRENLNKYSWVVVILVLVAVGMAIWTSIGGGGAPTSQAGGAGKAFYTTDDGKTWFADDVDKLAPFESNGMTAYGAAVFKCKDGQPFVGYLTKYSDKTRQAIEQARQGSKTGQSSPVAEMMALRLAADASIKKPGDKEWTDPSNAAKLASLRQVTCRNGSQPEPVAP